MDPIGPRSVGIGTVVDGKYTIESQLGEGGMGVVYYARNNYLGTPVVIKGVRPELSSNAEFRARILSEGRAMAKIDHENVVRLNSVVVENNDLYLVMQYVDGESLEDTITRYAAHGVFMPVPEVLRIFDQILAGVGAAHAEGMIHRDIKPANILIRRKDSQVRVTDFGIAKAEDDALAGKGMTRVDGFIGSVHYMSPEQIRGERNLDRRVDIYSLGIMLFETLTGQVPFAGPTAFSTMQKHVQESIPPIASLRADVPDHVRFVIDTACAKNRDHRFGSAAEMAAALRGQAPPSQPYHSQPAPSSQSYQPGQAVSHQAAPNSVPIAPIFQGGPPVVHDPFGGPGQPQRAKSPTEIAMGADSGTGSASWQAQNAQMPPQGLQPLQKGSTMVASPHDLAAALGQAGANSSPQAGMGHMGMAQPGMPPSVHPNPMVPSIQPMIQNQVTGPQFGAANPIAHGSASRKPPSGPSVFKNPVVLAAILVPVAAIVIGVPVAIYKMGQPWCKSSQSECGDVCCDNATEACGIDGTCFRRCQIDGINYSVGTDNPSNICQVCSHTSLAWESKTPGTACGEGMYCDGNSQCINACVIDGKVYPRGTSNPSNSCQLCLGANPQGWTSARKGSPCEAGGNSCDGSGNCVSAMSFAVGGRFSCGVSSAGAAQCWGVNDHGQLGNGSTKDSQKPVPVSGLGSGVSVIVPMRDHACAITRTGDAWCWGGNSVGQLSASDGDRTVPTKVWSGVRAIGGTQFTTCAITNSGAVVCKGAGYSNEEKAFEPQSDVVALTSGGYEHICALLSTGAVKCWDKGGIPTEKTGLSSNVTSLAAGGSHTCALTSTGSVQCWGWNKYGQLGSGTNTDSNQPVQVSGLSSGVKTIASQWNTTCALMYSGSVKCWGLGESGSLGPSYKVNKNTPIDVSALGSGSSMIVGGVSYGCVLTDKRVVKCWGWKYNYGGSGDKGMGYAHHIWTIAGFPQ